MAHNPLLLGDRLKRVINRDVILVSHVFVGGLAFIDVTFDITTTYANKETFYFLISGITILGFFRFFDLFKINSYPFIHLALYHILVGLLLILVTPINGVYVFSWLMLAYMTDFFFGLKGAILSMLVLIVVMEFGLLYQYDVATTENIITALSQFAIILSVSMFFVNTQQVTEQDRQLLVVSMDKAQLERQRLIALINSMGDGVVATDDQGKVIIYNGAALELLDTNRDLTDQPIQDFLTLITKDEDAVDIIAEAREKNMNIRRSDLLLELADREKINLYLNISPIKIGFRQNSERGFIVSMRDITREKSLEEERDEFISVISHELRTPIAITEANISNAMLIHEKKGKKNVVKEALEKAHKQTQYLANMLNDLATLSRAERGKLEFNLEPVDPREMVETLAKDYTDQAQAKKLKFKTKIAKKTPKEITTSRLYVKEILQNFITNSIKYTRKGSVSLTVEPGKDGGVVFRVIDTGIGISKSDQKKLFQKFFRSEDFRTRENSGTGLGLYITLKLAKLLHAKLDVKSTINEGSEFIVTIPSLNDDKSSE